MKVEDPFDRFFYLWIALIVAAQHLRRRIETPFRDDDNDRQKVLDYFRVNGRTVAEALRENNDEMLKLSRRRGTDYGDPIVDTGNLDLRRKFTQLAAHYSNGPKLSQEDLVESVAELFKKVRNNLFHGEKVYDDRTDVQLLESLNPILMKVLRKCESL